MQNLILNLFLPTFSHNDMIKPVFIQKIIKTVKVCPLIYGKSSVLTHPIIEQFSFNRWTVGKGIRHNSWRAERREACCSSNCIQVSKSMNYIFTLSSYAFHFFLLGKPCEHTMVIQNSVRVHLV